jgi:CxxC motif-containing protein (DUF1111 family)
MARAMGTGLVLCAAATARGDFGDPLAGSTQAEVDAFSNGRLEFATAETPEEGLGPVFNDVSCAACHTGPGAAIGGNTTRTEIRFGTTTNGMFDALGSLGGSLIQNQGVGKDGIDKKVHGCAPVKFAGETVPPQATITALRRTTPLFGLGLVDATPDQTFIDLANAQPMTIRGMANMVGQIDPVGQQQNFVGRFGWKAQNPTLHVFAGDAYLNEMGITNPLFPNENAPQGRDDLIQPCDGKPTEPAELEDDGSALLAFTDFMSLLAPPPRGVINPPVQQGEALFGLLGCNGCHVADLTTGTTSVFPKLNNVTFHPYSDFLLHDMGTLGDQITQGDASGLEMRTAPLWGVSARRTFLHDGRSSKLDDAILKHDGQAKAAREAFSRLSQGDQQRVIKFLNSL